ncbi:hypothetical protein G3I77_21045 [Streptomyces sp. D2-8]|nr:hypothetical protein [Streptomyces sp. D2-8]MCK8435411.1 hypothetical protein [Streptomyces sp. D2-8]
MARTLEEPIWSTADAAVEANPHEDFSFTAEPSARSCSGRPRRPARA